MHFFYLSAIPPVKWVVIITKATFVLRLRLIGLPTYSIRWVRKMIRITEANKTMQYSTGSNSTSKVGHFLSGDNNLDIEKSNFQVDVKKE